MFEKRPYDTSAPATISHRSKGGVVSIRPAISLIQCISNDARDRICRHLPWEVEKTAVVWHALPDSPEEIAAATVFLAQDIAKGITGQAINIDGGGVMS